MAKNNKFLLYRTNILGSTTEKIEHGELALNYNSSSPFIMFKGNDGSIQKLGALRESSGNSTYHTMTQKAITEQVTMPSDYNVTYPTVEGISLTNTLANTHTKIAIKNIDSNLVKIAEKINNSESSSDTSFETLTESVGLNNDLTYKTLTSSKYLKDAVSLNDADKILDSILASVSGNVVNLRNDLTTETNNRIAADEILQDNIIAEEEARELADENLQKTLQANIDNVESELQANINRVEESLKTNNDNLGSELQANIDAEKEARELADENLRNDLTTETNNRIAADENLQKTLQANIDAEKEARELADENLQKTLQVNIDAEKERAISAETAIRNEMATSFNNLDASVSDLTTNISLSITEENGKLTNLILTQTDIASEKALNAEIAARKAVDGQEGQTYVANTNTAYISAATSLNDADVKLDSAISNLKITAVTGDELNALGTNVKEAYKLIDSNNSQHGNYIKVYKDTSLEKVEFKDQKLYFTYILADGTTNTVEVDVSAFLTENEYGDGLQVIDHVVSARIGEDTTTNKNFLDLEDNGGTTKSLAVRSVDTDRTYTTEEITVMGGPLAKLLTDVGINKINAGTDIQTLLMTLLCKEIYPYNTTNDSWYMADEAALGNQKKVSYSTPNFTNSVAAPTINSFTTGTVEAGTEFTYSVTCSATTTKNTASTISNLTWGYSATDDDKADSTATSITKNWTSGINNDVYTLKTAVSGFNSITVADKTGTNASRPSYSQKVQVADGSNRISCSLSGCSYSATVVENPSVYMVSNLGKTDANIKTSSIATKTVNCATPTNSTSKTVTGARFSFAGAKQSTTGITNAMELTSANIRALSSKGTSTSFSITFPDNTSHVYIALPPGKTLTKVEDVGAFGTDIVASFKANTKTNISVEGANGYTAKAYTVYIYAPDALLGSNTYNVTIS